MNLRDEVAKAICIASGVDPDARGFGMGVTMPKGAEYALWEARLKAADAALAVVQRLRGIAL